MTMTTEQFIAGRLKLGISQSNLAEITGKTLRTVANWETSGPDVTAVRIMEWMLDGFRPPQFKRTVNDQQYKPHKRVKTK